MAGPLLDRKSTRLNSSHLGISYAVFCLKKKHRRRGPHHRAASGIRLPQRAEVRGELCRVAPCKLRFGQNALAGGFVVFFNDTATTEIYTLSLHDALPI